MQLFAEATTNTWLLALGIAVFASMMLARGRRPAVNSHEPTRSGMPARMPTPLEKPRDLEAWEAESHERIREWTAVLDTKIALLQQLVASAHHESNRLNLILNELQAARQNTAPLAPIERAAATRSPRAHDAIPQPTAQGRGPHALQSRSEIESLAASGRTPDEIARELGLPLGEVELIVNLRRQQESTAIDPKNAAPHSPEWQAHGAYLPGK